MKKKRFDPHEFEAEIAFLSIAAGIALGLALSGAWLWAGGVLIGAPLGLWSSNHQHNG